MVDAPNVHLTFDPTRRDAQTALLGCTINGMREVYEQTNQHHGLLVDADAIQADLSRDPLGDACWDQRATNEAMATGFQLHVGTLPVTRPPMSDVLFVRVISGLVPFAPLTDDFPGLSLLGISQLDPYHYDVGRAFVSANFYGLLQPDGTEIASGGMGDLLGAHPNGAYERGGTSDAGGLPADYVDPLPPWGLADEPDGRAAALHLGFSLAHAADRCTDLDAADLKALRDEVAAEKGTSAYAAACAPAGRDGAPTTGSWRESSRSARADASSLGVGEERAHVERELREQRAREHLAVLLRALERGAVPAFDGAVEVDEPVFADPRGRVGEALREAVVAAIGGGADLDAEVGDLIEGADVAGIDLSEQHEGVGLQDAARGEADVDRALADEHGGKAVERPHAEREHEPTQDVLVQQRRSRRHDDLSVQQLDLLHALRQGEELGFGHDDRAVGVHRTSAIKVVPRPPNRKVQPRTDRSPPLSPSPGRTARVASSRTPDATTDGTGETGGSDLDTATVPSDGDGTACSWGGWVRDDDCGGGWVGTGADGDVTLTTWSPVSTTLTADGVGTTLPLADTTGIRVDDELPLHDARTGRWANARVRSLDPVVVAEAVSFSAGTVVQRVPHYRNVTVEGDVSG